ncbi:hypothetical protein EZS27_040551, partial [termite gut metagenome]
ADVHPVFLNEHAWNVVPLYYLCHCSYIFLRNLTFINDLLSDIYILVVSGLGLVISNYSNTMQQAMFVMFFFVIILILMSGLFTPVESMPDWAQIATIVNPLKYFIQVMRAVYLKGSGVGELTTQLVALAGFAVCLNAWAVMSYKKRE